MQNLQMRFACYDNENPLAVCADFVVCNNVNSIYHSNKYNSDTVTHMCVILHVKFGIISVAYHKKLRHQNGDV
jgi:hypothetical protein